jgi:hypothetical protein
MAEEALRFFPRARLEPDFSGETQVGFNRPLELLEDPELRRALPPRLEIDEGPAFGPENRAHYLRWGDQQALRKRMPYRRRRAGPKRRRRTYRRSINPHYAYVKIHRDPDLRERDIEALQAVGSTGKYLFKDADPAQQLARKYVGWKGAGMYMGGRGAYSGVNRLKKAGRWSSFAKDTLSAMRGIAGMGDYETNEIVNGGEASMGSAPRFSTSADDLGGMIVTHTEYLTDIYGNSNPSTDNFELYEWSINPGLERSMPWLAQVASNFEEYELVQLLYTFRSTISNDVSSSNGQVGSIIMATNYNASAGPFLDKGTMMQYAGANSGKVTTDLVHGVECDPRQTSLGGSGLYVRSSPVVTGEDLKTYDLGIFSLAVSGTPTNFVNQPIGELWVTYRVKLRKPKLFTGLGSGISTDVYMGGGSGAYSLATWMGSNILKGQQNNIGTQLVSLGTGSYRIDFPANAASFYEVQCLLPGITVGLTIGWAFTVAGGITKVADFPAGSGNTVSQLSFGTAQQTASGTSALFHVKSQVSYNGVPNSMTITLSGGPITINANFVPIIRITEYNTMANPFKLPVLINSAGTQVVP